MFGLFKKRDQEIERKHALYNSVRAYYEGEVDSADYWDPENPEDFKGGIVTPDGEGKITFKRPLNKFSFFRFIIVAAILAVFSEFTIGMFQGMVSTIGYIVICWGFVSICNYFFYKTYVFR